MLVQNSLSTFRQGEKVVPIGKRKLWMLLYSVNKLSTMNFKVLLIATIRIALQCYAQV